MNWKNKKVLVTGANGFSGSNICREILKTGAEVKALVRKGGNTSNIDEIKKDIEIFAGDVTDKKSLTEATKNVDIVFNSAALVPVMKAREDPRKTLEINSTGTFNVAWCSMKNGVKRMVHISTCHVYGNQPESLLPLKEDVIPRPNDIYSASKYAAEIFLNPLINEGFDIVTTRAFNHFGPYQIGDFFVPRLLSKILKNEDPVLGSPNSTRDYSYVVDIAKGYIAVAEKGKTGEIYHLSSGKETSIGEFCDKILKVAKEDFNVSPDVKPMWSANRKLDMDRSVGDSSKARKELHWKPEISLEDGIRLTIEWWKSLKN